MAKRNRNRSNSKTYYQQCQPYQDNGEVTLFTGYNRQIAKNIAKWATATQPQRKADFVAKYPQYIWYFDPMMGNWWAADNNEICLFGIVDKHV